MCKLLRAKTDCQNLAFQYAVHWRQIITSNSLNISPSIGIHPFNLVVSDSLCPWTPKTGQGVGHFFPRR